MDDGDGWTDGSGVIGDNLRPAGQREHGGTEPDEAAGTAVERVRQIHATLATTDTATGAAVMGAPFPSDQVLSALIALRQLRTELAGWEPRLIASARAHGVSWAELAPALGVTSRQAAERRFLRLQPSETGEVTAEQRVEAQRARRAGDRAVAQWARQNSASLRQLAGQVSALNELDASAQQHADRVQQALAANDPVALLSPLADAHSHLAAAHTQLADQITTMTEQAEQLRRQTSARRQRDTRPSSPAPGEG